MSQENLFLIHNIFQNYLFKFFCFNLFYILNLELKDKEKQEMKTEKIKDYIDNIQLKEKSEVVNIHNQINNLYSILLEFIKTFNVGHLIRNINEKEDDFFYLIKSMSIKGGSNTIEIIEKVFEKPILDKNYSINLIFNQENFPVFMSEFLAKQEDFKNFISLVFKINRIFLTFGFKDRLKEGLKINNKTLNFADVIQNHEKGFILIKTKLVIYFLLETLNNLNQNQYIELKKIIESSFKEENLYNLFFNISNIKKSNIEINSDLVSKFFHQLTFERKKNIFFLLKTTIDSFYKKTSTFFTNDQIVNIIQYTENLIINFFEKNTILIDIESENSLSFYIKTPEKQILIFRLEFVFNK